MDSRKYFIVGTALLAMATGTWFSLQVLRPAPQLQTATILRPAAGIADFNLQSQNGQSFTADDFKGHWNLVFFGFTHCPDICPMTLQILANARRTLQQQDLDPLPRIVLVSVDPERDTPDILGQYVAHFGADTIGVTGELTEIRKFTDSLGVFFEKSGVDEQNYSVDHSAAVIIINPDGMFHGLFSAPHEAENFVHDLPILMSAK